MRRLALLLLSLLFAFTSHAAAPKPALPTLTVETDDGRHALELVAMRVETTIRGHLARTECELTYRNDLNDVVEGDFYFPLPADAELTGLGLYFNGKLRHAVAVERERARVAYERTVHQRVDPALVEWTSGRGAHLRVYPIPARGEKKVWLSYDQELLGNDYVLDLRYGKRMRDADVRIDADGRFVRDGFAVTHERPFTLRLYDEALDRLITVESDPRGETLAARDAAARRWYIVAAPRAARAGRAVEGAREVVVFWDSSGSAVRQDRKMLDAFLERFVARQSPGAKVTLIPFDVTAGSATSLSARDALHNIGATNYPALFARMRLVMSEAAPATRFVLVTDGISSLGGRREIARAAEELRALQRPLIVLNSSRDADDVVLARIANATNGWLLDLDATAPETAVEIAMRAPVARNVIAEERELPPAGAARELRHPREIAMVRSAYARATLRRMLLAMAPDEEILAHGRRFQQLTPRTSLLVLESWQDYRQWDIPMPDDVRREMEEEERRTARSMVPVVKRPVVRPPAQRSPATGPWLLHGVMTAGDESELPGVTMYLEGAGLARTEVTDENGRFTFRLDQAPSQFVLRGELSGYGAAINVFNRALPSGSTVLMTLNPSVSETITVTAEAPAIDARRTAVASFVTTGALSPDADALISRLFADTQSAAEEDFDALVKRRRETTDAVAAKMATIASIDERVRYYLSARTLLGGDKAFHLHAATLFQHDAPALATRILSELAEAYPDDSALLRILARILEGWKESELARLLLQHALEVAANESQTWRELVLLESRLGNAAAIEKIAADAASIDERVRDDIKKELEPLLARWRALPDSIRNAPHDLRLDDNSALQVDLMWDTNYNDVDLHVTEPSGEKVWYKNTRSAQGGRLHEDVTDGYGPELYTSAQPKAGEYQIAIDYFGVDETEIGIETLAHLVVYQRSRSGVDRKEWILLLTKAKEHRVVATVNVTR